MTLQLVWILYSTVYSARAFINYKTKNYEISESICPELGTLEWDILNPDR